MAEIADIAPEAFALRFLAEKRGHAHTGYCDDQNKDCTQQNKRSLLAILAPRALSMRGRGQTIDRLIRRIISIVDAAGNIRIPRLKWLRMPLFFRLKMTAS